MAGWNWLKSFQKRNHIILRKSEAKFVFRTFYFSIHRFQNILRYIIVYEGKKKYLCENLRYWLEMIFQKCPKVFVAARKIKASVVTCAEICQHVSLACCMDPSGTTVPPPLISLRKYWKNE